MEADTVSHGGGSSSGDFLWSLTLTDFHSGWTELAALWGNRAGEVRVGLERIEKRNGRASAVALDDGRVIEADAIIWNGDTQPIADGRLGDAIRGAVPARARVQRSLSALTWSQRRCQSR